MGRQWHECGGNEGGGQVHRLRAGSGSTDQHDSGRRLSADDQRGARGGGRAARSQQHHGFPGGAQLARGGDERTAVAHVLGVDGDGARPLVVGAGQHQVGERDVGLVAERDEARDPETARVQERVDVERDVAALRQNRDGAGVEGVGRELQRRRGVDDTEAVRADERRASAAHATDDLVLERPALVRRLRQARGDRDDRARTDGQRRSASGWRRRSRRTSGDWA